MNPLTELIQFVPSKLNLRAQLNPDLRPLTELIQFVPSKLNLRAQLNPDLRDNSPTPMRVLDLALCHLILQDPAFENHIYTQL